MFTRNQYAAVCLAVVSVLGAVSFLAYRYTKNAAVDALYTASKSCDEWAGKELDHIMNGENGENGRRERMARFAAQVKCDQAKAALDKVIPTRYLPVCTTLTLKSKAACLAELSREVRKIRGE